MPTAVRVGMCDRASNRWHGQTCLPVVRFGGGTVKREELYLMAQLLVSVRTLDEARAAVDGGADIIDVKEPKNGTLGRPADAIVAVIGASVTDRPVSIALGELTDGRQSDGLDLPGLTGIRWAKIGLAGCADWPGWREAWLALRESVTRATGGETRLVAAAYADFGRAHAPEPATVFELAAERESASVLLIDTWGKDGRGLLDWVAIDELAALSDRCRENGLRLALAGSLNEVTILDLRPVHPDILAVRGAACRDGQRDGTVDVARVRRLTECVRRFTTTDTQAAAAPAESSRALPSRR